MKFIIHQKPRGHKASLKKKKCKKCKCKCKSKECKCKDCKKCKCKKGLTPRRRRSDVEGVEGVEGVDFKTFIFDPNKPSTCISQSRRRKTRRRKTRRRKTRLLR